MKRQKTINQLADLIENHKNCEFRIDNDNWDILDSDAFDSNGDEIDGINPCLAESDNYNFETKWYSDSNQYGIGLAEVLLELLNRRGFNIKASAV